MGSATVTYAQMVELGLKPRHERYVIVMCMHALYSNKKACLPQNISPHAGCVVKCFTGIDYQMKRFEDQSDEEVWQDIQLATRNRR